jgi:aryl-alcohol dehydrogenase-like predicted oxidoreductase
VDLYQAHAYDSGTPLEETMRTFSDMVRSGKVRYIGVSNFAGWQLQKAMDLSRSMGLERFITYQGQYSLLCRDPEFEILPCAADNDVGYLPWSPLKGGWLAGRYKRGAVEAETGSRVQWAQTVGWKQTNFDTVSAEQQTWNVLDEVEKISGETGKSMAAVSLRWVMQRPGITSTIIGARTLEQLEQNLDAAWFSLTVEQMQRLNNVSTPRPIYPHTIELDAGNVDPRRRH